MKWLELHVHLRFERVKFAISNAVGWSRIRVCRSRLSLSYACGLIPMQTSDNQFNFVVSLMHTTRSDYADWPVTNQINQNRCLCGATNSNLSLERQLVAASGNEPARSFDDSRAGLKFLSKSFRVNFLNFCRNSGMKRSLIDSDAVMMLSVLCLLVRMFVESKSHNMSRGTVGRLHKGQ